MISAHTTVLPRGVASTAVTIFSFDNNGGLPRWLSCAGHCNRLLAMKEQESMVDARVPMIADNSSYGVGEIASGELYLY